MSAVILNQAAGAATVIYHSRQAAAREGSDWQACAGCSGRA